VLLLKSLICIQGYDNGRRFLLINLSSYFLLLILNPLLNQANIVMLLLVFITIPILIASSIRRINDAGFSAHLAIIPPSIFILSTVILSYVESNSRWAILLLSVITTLTFTTISNARIRRNHHYNLGYSGPVKAFVNEQIEKQSSRIEPTITAQQSSIDTSDLVDTSSSTDILASISASEPMTDDLQQKPLFNQSQSTAENSPLNKINWEQQFSQWIISNKKMALALISFLTILILTIIIFSSEPQTEDSIEIKPAIPQQKQRLNKIEMPDQFWIMLDKFDSLTIGWEGDYKSGTDYETGKNYWSAATGIGDKDCINLNFILGEKLRALNVKVKNNSDYYADFSPVDTLTIIQSIANKDRFRLCGYEFTLKGTGKLLRANKKYSSYLE